jgi:hypothetical protein
MAVMIRYFAYSAIVAILVLLTTYFLAPLIVTDPGVVARVAGWLLDWSNSRFDSTPPLLAGYISNLNLALVSLSAAVLALIGVLLLALAGRVFSAVAKGTLALLRRCRKKSAPADLPPIEMDPGFRESAIGKGVVGRGLDSIDRD